MTSEELYEAVENFGTIKETPQGVVALASALVRQLTPIDMPTEEATYFIRKKSTAHPWQIQEVWDSPRGFWFLYDDPDRDGGFLFYADEFHKYEFCGPVVMPKGGAK